MGVFAWIVVGAIAGWLADMFVGESRFGILGDIGIGVVGAFVGGWVAGRVFGISNAISGFNLTTVVVAFLGAALVLLIVNAVS